MIDDKKLKAPLAKGLEALQRSLEHTRKFLEENQRKMEVAKRREAAEAVSKAIITLIETIGVSMGPYSGNTEVLMMVSFALMDPENGLRIKGENVVIDIPDRVVEETKMMHVDGKVDPSMMGALCLDCENCPKEDCYNRGGRQ